MTRSAVVRRSLAASAVSLSLLGLAACGGDDGGSAASDPVGSSAAASSSTGAASPSASATTSDDAAPADLQAGEEVSASDFTALMKEAFDKATTAHMSMSQSASGLSAEGDIDYTKKPAEMAMTLEMAELGGTSEMRLVDGTMYLKTAMLGDQWVSMPLDDPDGPLGGLAEQLDPTSMFAAFEDGVTKATYDGAEDVDGESLDKYTVSIDTSSLVADLPPEVQGQAALPKSVEYQVWFQDDGLFRRLSVDLAKAGSIDVSFSDWGSEVSIEAPPTSQVTTMPGTSGMS